jgi:putative ABC transport system permease protein
MEGATIVAPLRMLQDLRYALRSFRRRPLVSLAAVATLALGIGGATAVFSIAEAMFLRPLPFRDADRLVRIWELTREGRRFSVSEPNYFDFRDNARALERLAAYDDSRSGAVLGGGDEPRRVAAVLASHTFADVLGVAPRLGRWFDATEDRRSLAQQPIVLSHGIWQRHFGGDPDVLGRLTIIDDRTYVVSGVMPPRFDFPDGAEVWIPLGADAASRRGDKRLALIGRLAPGATLDGLRRELADTASRLSSTYPESNDGWGAQAIAFGEWIVAPAVRDAVRVLCGAVGLLLLACANVANLLVAQAVARRGEMQVRAALGAGRGRLVRQLLTESSLLAAAGTVAGVLLAVWSVDMVQALGQGRVPRLDELRVDGSVLLFACATGAVSALVFGLVPAFYASKADLRAGLDTSGRATGGSGRLGQALVVVEVALALLLLVGTGLLANSFVRLMRVNTGFEVDNVVALEITLPAERYTAERAIAFFTDTEQRLQALAGVVAAGATTTNPFRQGGYSNSVTPEERAAEAPPSGLIQAGWRSVTPGFFESLRVPLLSGRTFADADRDGTERVVVVSASLARRLWPGGEAVGRRIYWGGTTGNTRTVIGVVGDIRDTQLQAEPTPILFLPHAQVPVPSLTLVVRMTDISSGAVAAVRDAVRAGDAALPAPEVTTLRAGHSRAAAGPRFNLVLLGSFALVALVLAVTGVYALLAFNVGQRRRELAVRLALGASGGRVARLVLSTGVLLTATGVVVGIALSLGATRVLKNQLFGVDATDPLTFLTAAVSLMLAASLACYLPARQAARIDPAVALRE